MKFAVDPWDPGYGAVVDDRVVEPSDVPTELHVEVPVADWAPIRPPPETVPAPILEVVDGVQRIDARVWVSAGNGEVRAGVCASYAAGVVRCNHTAELVAARVERIVVSAAPIEPITTRHAVYAARTASGDDPFRLDQAVQAARAALEVRVAHDSADPAALVVVDGPLSQHRYLKGAVGWIKRQHTSYGPPVVAATATALAAGERTPVFVVGERWQRFSWYLRLPGARNHPWAGIVRCEATTELAARQAVRLADEVAATMPRYASHAHKDPRAPQNLYPIAGLERELRRRLGDPALLYRSLCAAAMR